MREGLRRVLERIKKLKERPYLKKAAIPAIAAIALTAAAVSSSAFWTDMISLTQKVDSMKIAIEFDNNDIEVSERLNVFLPGDTKDIGFTIMNTGDISVDIKPVIELVSSREMDFTGNNYMLLDENGGELTAYEAVYYDKNNEIITDKNEKDNITYSKIVYTLKNKDILSGNIQNDAGQDETVSNMRYAYKLKLNEDAGNELQGAELSINVRAYAIQHRNRNGSDEWIAVGENK